MLYLDYVNASRGRRPASAHDAAIVGHSSDYRPLSVSIARLSRPVPLIVGSLSVRIRSVPHIERLGDYWAARVPDDPWAEVDRPGKILR